MHLPTSQICSPLPRARYLRHPEHLHKDPMNHFTTLKQTMAWFGKHHDNLFRCTVPHDYAGLDIGNLVFNQKCGVSEHSHIQ